MTHLESIKSAQLIADQLRMQAQKAEGQNVVIGREALEQIEIALLAGLLAGKEKTAHYPSMSTFNVENDIPIALLDWDFAKGASSEDEVWLIMGKSGGAGDFAVAGPFSILSADLRGMEVVVQSQSGFPAQLHVCWPKVGKVAFFSEQQAKQALGEIERNGGIVNLPAGPKKRRFEVCKIPLGPAYDPRYCIIDAETGELLDDAFTWGYPSRQTAAAAWVYKTRERGEEWEEAKPDKKEICGEGAPGAD